MPGPNRYPRPRVQGGNADVGNRLNLINKIIDTMGLTSEAIAVYNAQHPGEPAKQAAAFVKADEMYKALDKLSLSSLQMLKKSTPQYMQGMLYSSPSDYAKTQDRLGTLAQMNRLVESKFIEAQPGGHMLAGPMALAAERMKNLNLGAPFISQALTEIKRQKDTGTGFSILSDFLSQKGAVAQRKFATQNMNLSALRQTYEQSSNGVDISNIKLIGETHQLDQRKAQFFNRLDNDTSLDPGEREAVRLFVGTDIRNLAGMEETERIFASGGNAGAEALRSNFQKIRTIQTLANRRQLTTAEAINKFNFMRTTRGKVHAFADLATSMTTGSVTPAIGMTVFGLQALSEAGRFAKNYIPLGLSAGSQSPGFSGGLAAITGNMAAFRTLRGVGQQNALPMTLLNAFISGKTPQQIAQQQANYVGLGLPTGLQKALINASSQNFAGLSSEQFSNLLAGTQIAGGINPSTNFAQLTAFMSSSNPDQNPLKYANVAGAAGGLASSYNNQLMFGLLAGKSPEQIYSAAKSGLGANLIAEGYQKVFAGMPAWLQPAILQSMGAQNPIATAQILSNVDTSAGGQPSGASVLGGILNNTGLARVTGGITGINGGSALNETIGVQKAVDTLLHDYPNITQQYSSNDIAGAIHQMNGMEDIPMDRLQQDVNKALQNSSSKAGLTKGSPLYVEIVGGNQSQQTGANASSQFRTGGR